MGNILAFRYKAPVALLAAALGLLALLQPAAASQPLLELEIAPFSIAAHPKLKVSLSADDSGDRADFAYIIPQATSSLDVLHIAWPKGKRSADLAVAQTTTPEGQEGPDVQSSIGVSFDDEDPQLIKLPAEATAGVLSRLAVWPTSMDEKAGILIVMSFTSGVDDATMAGIILDSDGSGRVVDLGNAHTLYGWFDVEDIGGPDDGYELITRRNLDGTLGGFFYRAVRRFDDTSSSFVVDPQAYKDFFKEELDFLSWVLDTRQQMQTNPVAFENKDDFGPQYVASYQGESYGFDSLLEVPASYNMGGPGDRPGPSAEQINQQARRALKYVKDYHDELQAWLAGGDYPATWRVAH